MPCTWNETILFTWSERWGLTIPPTHCEAEAAYCQAQCPFTPSRQGGPVPRRLSTHGEGEPTIEP